MRTGSDSEAQMREERRQQQGSTHSVEGKKKQTHRPLSHTSSVTERNKQVCCTALSLPPPLLLSLGGARLLRDSPPPHCQEQNLSAALFSSSSLPGASGSQDDAGGVYHGGVRCSRSRPTGRGGRLGVLGCPFQTSPSSQTSGRSVLMSCSF